MSIVRNSFIQISKLTNLKGRINYISSHARQENLYAVCETIERKFWTELAECNQEEFKKSGTEGKCIEARELIIALPESFVDYEQEKLLKLFTEHFKQNYRVECISALHHNKRKTNYHIHLIFSERKLLDEPIEKTATRNMFYDENGKHVRTKKEILDETGKVKEGCKIIPKGEVYERNLFTKKDNRFKSEMFLDEVKRSYTELINIYVKEENQKLKVFDKNCMYLPTKKIGKHNPKAEQIKEDNEQRVIWNQTVDRALVSGVPEVEIMEVKQKEISNKARASIEIVGNEPQLFKSLIMFAVCTLEGLINMVLKKILGNAERTLDFRGTYEGNSFENIETGILVTEDGNIAEKLVKSIMVSKYPKLTEVYRKLEQQNEIIYLREQSLTETEKELAVTQGMFQRKRRKELQEQIERLKEQINDLKRYLPSIVQCHGYKNVKEFLNEYKVAKSEYEEYRTAVVKWEKLTGEKMEEESFKTKFKQKREVIKKRKNVQKSYKNKKDRDAR